MNKATVIELAFNKVMDKLDFSEFVKTTVKFDDVLYAFTKDCPLAVQKIALDYLLTITSAVNAGLQNSEKAEFYERPMGSVTRERRFWTK